MNPAMIPSTSAMDKPVERTRSTTRRILAGAAIGGGLLGALLLAPTVRRWSRAERAVEGSSLRVGQVVRGDLERDVAAQGKIVAALHPTLFSPAQGIVSLAVKAGTEVKKGRLLARIESPELNSRLQQERSGLLGLRSDLGRQRIAARQAQVRSKQAIDVFGVRLAAARRALERAQVLFDRGLLNRTDFEKAQDDVQVADLELKNAAQTAGLEQETLEFEATNRALQVERGESIVREIQRKVDELSLLAPFDGVVATITVQDRDAVAPNQAILTVVNLDAFEVEFEIPENYASDVAHGTPAEILYEGRTYPGRVTAVSPEIKDSQVKGTLAFEGEPPPNLRQSQRVSVRLVLERRPGVLKLPRGPFLESGGGRHAYVVEGGVAAKQPIEVGAVSVSEVEVLKGLKAGDKVVLSDTSTFDGARIVLIRE